MTAPQTSTPAARHRFHLLDALRGIAAVVVILVHAPEYLNAIRIAPNAFLAVDFFFCLSGFVVAFSYKERLETGKLSFGSFARARLTRLYPVYLFGTVLGLTSLLLFDRHITAVATSTRFTCTALLGLLLLPNVFPTLSHLMFPADLPAWSLFFEMLINLVVGILWARKLLPMRTIFISATVGLGALIWWIGSPEPLGMIGWQSAPSLLFLDSARVALSFSCGLLVQFYYRKTAANGPSGKLGLSAAVVVGLLFVLCAPFEGMRAGGFQLFCIAVIFPGLVFAGAHARLPDASAAVCALLGEVSYPMYLLHSALLRPLGFRAIQVFARQHPVQAQVLLPADIIATVWVSYLVWKWYDTPLRRFISKLGRSTKRTAALNHQLRSECPDATKKNRLDTQPQPRAPGGR